MAFSFPFGLLLLSESIDAVMARNLGECYPAPGVEINEGEAEFLFRTGLAYEFEYNRWSITPEFNVDFTEGKTALVYGVNFGIKCQAPQAGLQRGISEEGPKCLGGVIDLVW